MAGYIYLPDNSVMWREFGLRLAEHVGVPPVMWVSHDDDRPEDISRFPETIFVGFHQLNFGVVPRQEFSAAKVTDCRLFVPSTNDLYMVMRSYDRYDSVGQLRTVDREALAMRLLQVASAVLDQRSVRALVQVDSPHWPFEIALDRVAATWGIPRMTIKRLTPFARAGVFDGLEGAPLWMRNVGVPRLLPNGGGTPEENEVVAEIARDEDYLRHLLDDDRAPDYMVEQERSQRSILRTQEQLARLLALVRGATSGRSDHFAFRQYNAASLALGQIPDSSRRRRRSSAPGGRWPLLKSVGRRTHRVLYERRANRRLVDAMQTNATGIAGDLGKTVCFFLHFEPERTTLAEGGVDNWLQLRAIVALREALPETLDLIVQEHPSYGFPRMAYGYVARSSLFAEVIAGLPGVALVSAGTVRRPELTRLAGVVTITGTVGLEASLRGVPVLCLGFPWYRWVEGLASGFIDEFVAQVLEGKESGGCTAQEALLRFLTSSPPWPSNPERPPALGPSDELLELIGQRLQGL